MKTSYEYLRAIVDSAYLAWREGIMSLAQANKVIEFNITACGWTEQEYDLYPLRKAYKELTK